LEIEAGSGEKIIEWLNKVRSLT